MTTKTRAEVDKLIEKHKKLKKNSKTKLKAQKVVTVTGEDSAAMKERLEILHNDGKQNASMKTIMSHFDKDSQELLKQAA